MSIADYQLPWFGRRLINHISMIFTLASLAIVAGYVYIGNGGYVVAIGTTVALAMCSQLFIAKYLMVNELYPTAVRNLAVSAVSTMSRVGGMFSPQLFYLVSFYFITILILYISFLLVSHTLCYSLTVIEYV